MNAGAITNRWTDRTGAWLAQPEMHRRLALVLTVGLALVCLWLLARIGWLLLTPPQLPPSAPLPESSPAVAENQPAAPNLSHWHLFGRFEASPGLEALRNAPETDLALSLRGIVAGSDPESGYAIIVANGRQAAYGIGQEVVGSARVRAIYPDRVVLARDGIHETLRLRETGGGNAAPIAEPSVAPASAAGAPPSGAVGLDWQQAIAERLATTASASGLGLVPVASGGFRLFLSRDAAAISRLGFRNGDIITSVNGTSVNNEQAIEQAVQRVLAGETLRIGLVRGGKSLTISPDIGALNGQ